MFTPRMRYLVTIEEPTFTQDSNGEEIPTWGEFAEVYAAAEPTRGREFFAAAGIHAEAPMLFRIHYLAGVTPLLRVIYNSKTWQIKSVVDFREMRRDMHLNSGRRDRYASSASRNTLSSSASPVGSI